MQDPLLKCPWRQQFQVGLTVRALMGVVLSIGNGCGSTVNQAIRVDPQFADAYDIRARLWATCPDARCRDGKRAIESASKACDLTRWKSCRHIDTLAAAYAEASDFDAAVKWQSKAVELLSDKATKDDYRARLKLYQAKKPYRETGAPGPRDRQTAQGWP